MNWWTRRKITNLKARLAAAQASEAVWKITVVNADKTNSYFVERWANYSALVASLKSELESAQLVQEEQ